MAEEKKQNYLHGAAILAATVAIVKVIGAIYKIPIGNILGDDGYANFIVAYNIYSMLLSISTAGLPVALSKMISVAHATGRENQVKRIFTVAKVTFLVLGLAGGAIMFFFPKQLAGSNPDAALSIQALAPSLLFVCLISAYRGYAQGFSNMIPTSVSQIIEGLCKLAFGLTLALLAVELGYGASVASAGAILGVSISSLAAFIYLWIHDRRTHRRKTDVPATDQPDSRGKILKQLLAIGIPITIGSSILSIITVIDTQMVLSRLQDALGLSLLEAQTLTGVYGKAQTLFNLPSSFIVPITLSIMPAIASCLAQRNHQEATGIVESSIRITALIAFPAGIGLSVLANPIFDTLYMGSAAEGPPCLMILGVASIFVCLTLVSSTILQSYGYERIPLYTMPVGGVVKIAINWFLVGNPSIGIIGAPIGTLACYVVIFLLNMFFVYRKVPHPPRIAKSLGITTIASVIMGAAAWAIYGLGHRFLSGPLSNIFGADSRLVPGIPMVIAIFFAIVIYGICARAFGILMRKDIKLLPKGEKIANVLKLK